MKTKDTFYYTRRYRGRRVPVVHRILYLARAVLLCPILVIEIKALLGIRRPRTNYAVTFMNDISNATNGTALDLANSLICILRHKDTERFDELVEKTSGSGTSDDAEAKVEKAVQELSQFGFSRLQDFLSFDLAISIATQVTALPGRSTIPSNSYKNQLSWLQDSDAGPRFDILESSISSISEIREIESNTVVMKIARRYLGCSPIHVASQIWSTRPPNVTCPAQLSEAAMAYHCDSDYFGFVKFFILLTDVAVENGPFTFVSKSHRGDRHVAGRMHDNEIVKDGDELHLGTGQVGDLIIADTKGWHKAAVPEQGVRTMLQLVFSSSQFGGAT